jgi:hypothetical protein
VATAGTVNPVTRKSYVDMPVPFSPTIPIRSPAARERDGAEQHAVAEWLVTPLKVN